MYRCILKTWRAMYGMVGFDPPIVDVFKAQQAWKGTISRETDRIYVYCGSHNFEIGIRNRFCGRRNGEFIEAYDGLFYELFPSMDAKWMIIKSIALEKGGIEKSISSIKKEGLRYEYHGNG